jgi:DNA-binding LacI/PurR family transcriptional regulator
MPVSRQITLKDVARAAKCSTAVVSTVINRARGNTLVSAELRRRVETTARELGYRADFASRSLVRKSTQTLGIYIPPGPWAGTGFAYESEILTGVEEICRERNYDLLLINLTGNQTPDICEAKLTERRIDGLLLVHVEPGSPWVRDLAQVGHNIVAVDYPSAEPGVNVISFDNAAAARVAVDHLVDLGHRRLGYIGSCREPVHHDAAVRQQAFLQRAAELGLELRPEWVFDRERSPHKLRPDDAVCQVEGQLAADYILSLGSAGPTAWLAYGDMVAAFAMPRLQAGGVRIPQDLSLMGVDDSHWCQMVTPHLTSVRHPLREMGRRAAELLINNAITHVDGDSSSQEMARPQLVVRQSTAPYQHVARTPHADSEGSLS